MQVVTRASAGVALGDTVLRALMDTSYVDLVFLEQEMQLMVKDAVASKGRGESGGTMSTNGGVMKGVGFSSPLPPGDDPASQSMSGDEEDLSGMKATDTLDLSAKPNGAAKTPPKNLVQAAAAQTASESIVNATVDLGRDEKHDVRCPCCVLKAVCCADRRRSSSCRHVRALRMCMCDV